MRAPTSKATIAATMTERREITMSITASERVSDGYALARNPVEYERLRAQSRVWEAATGRVLDEVALAPGASCLDAGCGPGETMRLMAQRVGLSGRVTGVDVDAPLGAQALTMLHNDGHRQCAFVHVDLTTGEPIPGAPFDLVYARLLLFHLPERVAVLRRLWDAVAPGGHLVVQDYDLRSVTVEPALESAAECRRVIVAAFSAAGCDVNLGALLPELFAGAGIGAPDGTDVAGRLEPLGDAQRMITGVYTSVLAAAIESGITTEERATASLSRFAGDARRFPDRPTLWPLLIGAWKRKPTIAESERTR
jgi:ubiquinone/menaquinone biosynthesis C-methylase UbiE